MSLHTQFAARKSLIQSSLFLNKFIRIRKTNTLITIFRHPRKTYVWKMYMKILKNLFYFNFEQFVYLINENFQILWICLHKLVKLCKLSRSEKYFGKSKLKVGVIQSQRLKWIMYYSVNINIKFKFMQWDDIFWYLKKRLTEKSGIQPKNVYFLDT